MYGAGAEEQEIGELPNCGASSVVAKASASVVPSTWPSAAATSAARWTMLITRVKPCWAKLRVMNSASSPYSAAFSWYSAASSAWAPSRSAGSRVR